MPTTVMQLAAIGLLLVGVSHVIRTYREHRRRTAPTEPRTGPKVLADGGTPLDAGDGDSPRTSRVVDRERMRAHREIMAAIIALNRRVVEMDATELREEADLLAHGGDSALAAPHGEVTETYQSYFYIISPEVREAVSEYTDYLATYHDEGAQAGELLSLSGVVAEAMRADFDLEPLFEQSSVGGGEGPSATDADTEHTE